MGAGGEEFTKALALLVHDLRAPLSVASGYLRLIREDRLTSDEDRERAFTGVLEAVKRISRLCDEASDFGSAHDSSELPTSLVKAGELAERVCAVLQSEGTAVEPCAENNGGYVRVTQPDRIASAVANILRTGLRPAAQQDPVGMEVVLDERGLRFLAGTATERHQLADNEALPFDPWRGGHGLQLPTACRDLQRVAGRIWTTARTRSAICVHLPLEARAS
jgi:light-regulated signal transduction histidine kinase (bacteriophytochrome)